MSNLKKTLLEVDKSLDLLKDEIKKKDTLHISEDEMKAYKMINEKYSDIISMINYIGKCQNELSSKTRKNTF